MSSRLLRGAAWLSLAFWLYYAFLRLVAGPLGPDEVYFAHTLWLVGQGKQQYVDFYSNHLPAYFQLFRPLVSAFSDSPGDLSYLLGLRSLSGVIIAGYLALTWTLRRDGRTVALSTAALLLVFLVQARMVEVRTDTIGLLLVNGAWALMLAGRTTGRMVAAAVLAGLAILFSARGVAMAGVAGLLLLYLAWRARDRVTLRALLCVAASFLGAGLTAWLLAPEWVTLVIRSCFVGAAQLTVGVPFGERFLTPDRLPLSLLIAGGFLAGLWIHRRGLEDQGLIVAVACGAQLLMLAADPNPFEYVYGWSAVPAVFAMAAVGRSLSVLIPFSMAALLAAGSAGFHLQHGQAPPVASPLRLTFDATLSKDAVSSLPTPELVALLVTDRQQKNLLGQLRVRSEVCRRLDGLVSVTFDTHPICLHDAMYHWTGLKLPLLAGASPTGSIMSAQVFGGMLATVRPPLVIWRHRWEGQRVLLPATSEMLACCYDIYEGFALRKGVP